MKKILLMILACLACRMGYADTKISAMTSTTTLNSTDIVPVVANPSGSATNNIITKSNLMATLDITSLGNSTATLKTITDTLGQSTFTLAGSTAALSASTGAILATLSTAAFRSTNNTFTGTNIFQSTVAVSGQVFLSSNVFLNASQGTSGQVVTSSGTGFPPYWSTPAAGGGGGSIVNSTNQYNVAFFSVSGSSNTLSGADRLQVNTSSVTVKSSMTVSPNGGINSLTGMLDVFAGVSFAGRNLLTIGSVGSANQVYFRDQQSTIFTNGQDVRCINIGSAGDSLITSCNTSSNFVNIYNHQGVDGRIGIGTGADPLRTIVLAPGGVDNTVVFSSFSTTMASSFTVTNASGIKTSSFTLTTGGLAGRSVCWKTNTTLSYCTTTVGASGDCTCN